MSLQINLVYNVNNQLFVNYGIVALKLIKVMRKSYEKVAKTKREAIVELKDLGWTNAKISRTLKVSESNVSRTIKRYQELGHCGDKPRSRMKTVRTSRAVRNIRERVRRNPNVSTRRLAKSMNISQSSAHRIIKKDLKMTWKPKRYRHLLSEATKKKRKLRCRQLLQRLKSGPSEVIWTDEKIFTVEPKLNRKTDGAYAVDHSILEDKYRFVGRRQKPASVMVWAGVTTSGKKTPLIFVEQGVKINGPKYVEMMQEDVLPWLEDSGAPYLFMQDEAPAHTSNVAQNWCRENFHDFLDKTEWPPSSPDCNPMDFSIWGILDGIVSKVHYKSINALKAALRKAWDDLPEETVRAAVASVSGRLRAVVRNKGGHIEQH